MAEWAWDLYDLGFMGGKWVHTRSEEVIFAQSHDRTHLLESWALWASPPDWGSTTPVGVRFQASSEKIGGQSPHH